MNVVTTEEHVLNLSKYAITEDKTLNGLTIKPANPHDSKFIGVGNLFVSKGETGKVSRQNFYILYIFRVNTCCNYSAVLHRNDLEDSF